MADKKVEQQKEGAKKKNSFLVRRVLPLAFMLVALLFMPTTMIIMVGMLPSLVAFYVDNDRRKMGAMAILFLNLTPVVVYVMILWGKKHDIVNALDILMDPMTVTVIYFSCFVGMMLNKFIPPIVGDFLRRNGVKRLAKIEKEQKELVKAWGPDVMKPKK